MLGLSEFELAALPLSLKVSVTNVIASLPFGVTSVWLLARFEFPAKAVVDALLHLPLVVPSVVMGYLLPILLRRSGPIGGWMYGAFCILLAFNWKGAAITATLIPFPLMVRSMRLSLKTVERRLEAAARTLGASRLRVFLTITIPLMTPGILAASVLFFARARAEFDATITFVSKIPGETQTLPLALYTFVQSPDGEFGALSLALISILISLLALIASEWLAKRFTKASQASR